MVRVGLFAHLHTNANQTFAVQGDVLILLLTHSFEHLLILRILLQKLYALNRKALERVHLLSLLTGLMQQPVTVNRLLTLDVVETIIIFNLTQRV